MAGHWTQRDTPSQAQVSAGAVAGLLQDLERRPAGAAALHFLSGLVPLDYLSMVGYVDGGSPHQIEGHAVSWRKRETTLRCFALYRSRFFRYDEATQLAHDLHVA